jgi:hypothetical protein
VSTTGDEAFSSILEGGGGTAGEGGGGTPASPLGPDGIVNPLGPVGGSLSLFGPLGGAALNGLGATGGGTRFSGEGRKGGLTGDLVYREFTDRVLMEEGAGDRRYWAFRGGVRERERERELDLEYTLRR